MISGRVGERVSIVSAKRVVRDRPKNFKSNNRRRES